MAQFVTRLLPLLLWLAAAAGGGCRTAGSDLSAPAEWTPIAAEPVVVARGGAVLPVVTDELPRHRWAAMFLAGVIGETCGQRPEVLVVQAGRDCGLTQALFVGGDGREPADEGFRVVARDGCVRFSGRADYAVFDWCERALGFRYYCPEGRCAERRTEIVVPAVDYADRPVYEHRRLGGDRPWARFAKEGSVHRGGVAVHAPHGWHREAQVKAEHPEIFENGITPMLCYGNPATLAYYQRRIDRHIAGVEDSGGIVDNRRKVVTVSPWDAPVRCDCPWCRTQYAYGGDVADRASPVVWGGFLPRLSAWLKETHPDYLISFLPYWNACGVPWKSDPVLADNCEAEVCTMPGLALLKDEPCRVREETILRDWQSLTGRKVLSWHYGCWPQERTSAPYVFGRTIRRHCRDMRDVACGTFICGGADDPRLALSMYVWMKCLWNPELDVEAVYDGFARRMFGPAERPMRKLIDLQETCWNRRWTSTECTYRNVFETSYPRADVERMRALLQAAEAAARAANDEDSLRRVGWYASGFRRFFAESDALAERLETTGRLGFAVRPGETNEMVRAREVFSPAPWVRTTVVTRADRRAGELALTVRCDDPAAAKMDFTTIDHDAVWGDDSVTFVFEEAGGVRAAKVYKDGSVEGVRGETWLSAAVTHDKSGWTVTARVRLTAVSCARGFARGNVCRWRVGDRRQPSSVRVPGSRYEHCRLCTCYTHPDGDPAALVDFLLEPERKGGCK